MGMTQGEIGEKINRSQSAIANALRLLELPEVVQVMIAEGHLSVSHGKALARWKRYPALCNALANAVIEERRPSKSLEGDEIDVLRIFSSHIGVSIIIPLNNYTSPKTLFSTDTICVGCPHHRGGQYNQKCLDPKCFKEANAQAAAVNQREYAELVERTIAKGSEGEAISVSRSALKADQFEWLDRPRGIPAGCADTCANRVATTERGIQRPICLDPACYTRLSEKAKEQARDARKAAAEARMQQVWTGLADQPRSFSVMALHLLHSMPHRQVTALFASLSAKIDLPSEQLSSLITTTYRHEAEILDVLVSLPLSTLIIICASCRLFGEVFDGVTSEYAHETRVTDWFLGEVATTDEDKGTDLSDDPSGCDDCTEDDQRCETCPLHRVCRVCGCDDRHACMLSNGEPCAWVTDDLCSACAVMTDAGVQLIAPLETIPEPAQKHTETLPDEEDAGACDHCPVDNCPPGGKLQCTRFQAWSDGVEVRG
jgi:hypothetical protein